MKKYLLPLCLVIQVLWVLPSLGQVLNPNDPIVVYNPNNPPKQPTSGQIGKWVITPWANWDTDSYKAYIYKDLPFRIKFPKNFNAADSKKYPLILMLHGGGENANSLYDNELQLKWGAKEHRDAIDNGVFNGFAVFPQIQTDTWTSGQLTRLSELLNLLINQVDVDPDRISVHGLSVGGQGVWTIISEHASLFASAVPMSAAKSKFLDGVSNYIYMPLWLSQGGKDTNPDPSAAEYLVNKITGQGGNIRYSFYPNNSHNTWQSMYAEPDFFPFFNRANKTNPHVFYGKTDFCPGETINVKLGLGKGFQAYEWRKDGTVISGATSNELVVTKVGKYEGRFKRDGVWSSWSVEPVIIKLTSPVVAVEKSGSTALPTPAGQNSVTLSAPTGYSSYKWSNGATSRSITVSTAGTYTVTATSSGSCGSGTSDPVVVTVGNGANAPAAPSTFVALVNSATKVNLTWKDNATNETAYEIYNSTDQNSGYQLLTVLAANSQSYQHTVASTSFTHYYKIRAINNNGGSAVVSAASSNSANDTSAPTIPQNLVASSTGSSGVNLTWQASSDNVGVAAYDVYRNGSKVGSTANTSYSPSGLTKGQLYYFHVLARDAAGNKSAKSNQSTAYAGTGSGTPTGPTAPTGLTASASSYQQINLTWTDKSNNESGFEIYQSLTLNGTYEFVYKVGSNAKNYNRTGLQAGTTYYFKIRAVGNKGESAFTAAVNAKTQAAPNVPSAPTNLTASAIVTNSLTLKWTDNSGNETGFRVKRATSTSLPNYTQVAQLGSNVTQFKDTNLQPHTEYFYQVVAYNVGGESGALSKSFTTSNSTPVLASVTEKSVDFGVQYEFDISATDSDSDDLTFSLSNAPGFMNIVAVSTTQAKLQINAKPGNVGSYTNIQVKVKDNFGGSASKSFNLTVNELTAIGTSKSTIVLSWSDRTDETGYQVERREVGGSFSQVGTTNANVTSFTDKNLTKNTTFEYRIKGKGGSSVTQYSNVATASTSNYQVSLNFNQANPESSPWNNTNRVPQLSDVFSSLKKDDGQNSGFSVEITKNFDGENPYGKNTGNNAGVVPDNVMRSTYWLDAASSGQLKVKGLKQAESYNFVFFASREDNNKGTNRTTDYSVNGVTVSLNASDNTKNIVAIDKISPNSKGEVLIDIKPGTGSSYGYIGALIINANNSSTTARILADASFKKKVEPEVEEEITEQIVAGEAFPNPFVDQLTVKVPENTRKNVSVKINGSSGKVIYHKNVKIKHNESYLELNDIMLDPGVYILTVTNESGTNLMNRIIKY